MMIETDARYVWQYPNAQRTIHDLAAHARAGL